MPRGAGLAADRGPNTASPDAPAGRRRGTKTTHTKEYPADVRYWDKGRAPREDVPQGTEPAIPDSGLAADRSEEHTSELQSRGHLVCRLLLEKKKHFCFRHLSNITGLYLV